MSDRTGELCPFCKKGKLYPTGEREIKEPDNAPKSGEIRREHTEYECGNCHRKTGGIGISLVATVESSVALKVTGNANKSNEKKKKQKHRK
jgi:hypothetical protein